jgi:hypothetical protein
MKEKDLTPEELISVPCPICGVYAGPSCILYSGDLRSGPHVDQKLAAAEAIEEKRSPAKTLSLS